MMMSTRPQSFYKIIPLFGSPHVCLRYDVALAIGLAACCQAVGANAGSKNNDENNTNNDNEKEEVSPPPSTPP